MNWKLANRTTSVCCSLCRCLGYCAREHHDELHRPSFKVLTGRSFEDFEKSAREGCRFCDVLLQSFMLLQCVERSMQVEVLLYPQSPTELHSLANKDVYDVVEVYPSSADGDQSYPEVGTDVLRKSTLEASVQFLRENYYSCITDHENCWSGPTFLPKRVVDISEARYRLVEPPSDTKENYVALSYSWGFKGFAMTTFESYEGFKHGFDPVTLPIAFQDAALMAQSLNIRYIWIDTLCIIQDSLVDWEEEAAKMGNIFEGATITIAASSVPDPDHTLFETRKARYQEIELYSDPDRGSPDIVFKARRKIVQGIHAKTGQSTDMDPLDSRAWGLQEKLLSTRLLAFTGAELQWTCRTLKACECHPNSHPSKPLFPTPVAFSSTEMVMKHSRSWSQVIEEYSARELTVLEDKLPALSGLASKFGAVSEFMYIAGIWKETFLYDLVWQRDAGPLVIPATCLGPSFSWVSVPGAVNFRLARHSYPGSRIEHTRLIDYSYKTASCDAYGRALCGSLTVQGHTLAAKLWRSSEDFQVYTICIGEAAYLQNTGQRAICEFSMDATIPNYDIKTISEASTRMSCKASPNDSDQKAEEPIILLSLYSIYHRGYLYQNFLILAESHDDIHSYKRVGVGSGKLYRGNGCEGNIPSQQQLVRPFEWLSVDFERSGHSIGEIVERVVCIQ